jgi:hypothetical protein
MLLFSKLQRYLKRLYDMWKHFLETYSNNVGQRCILCFPVVTQRVSSFDK